MSCPLDGDKLLSLDMRNLHSCVGTCIHKVVVSSHRFVLEHSAGFKLHHNGILDVFQTLQPHIADADVLFALLFFSLIVGVVLILDPVEIV